MTLHFERDALADLGLGSRWLIRSRPPAAHSDTPCTTGVQHLFVLWPQVFHVGSRPPESADA